MTMQSILIGVQRENLFSTITNIQAVGLESATAQYRIVGGIERATTSEDGFTFPAEEHDWLVPNQFGYNYEVRATLFVGGPVNGTFDTFIAADSNPSWLVFINRSNESVSATIDFDFRRKGDTNILLTKQVSLSAFSFA
jgi:hypothetical protein